MPRSLSDDTKIKSKINVARHETFLPPANEVWGKVIFSQATAMGGTHPTGMHSCLKITLRHGRFRSHTQCIETFTLTDDKKSKRSVAFAITEQCWM